MSGLVVNARLGEFRPPTLGDDYTQLIRVRKKSINTPRTTSRPPLLFLEPAGRKMHNTKSFRFLE